MAKKPLNEEPRKALWRVYDILLSLPAEPPESEPSPDYESMTDEERRTVVYERWQRGELQKKDMTEVEMEAWAAEEGRGKEREDNFHWNIEHHRHLLKRVRSIRDKLTDAEYEEIEELWKSCRWGRAEVEQVKEIIETAEWFSKLGS